MKQVLTLFSICFTLITLLGIGINGFFQNWTPKATEIWGYFIGMGLLCIILWHHFFKKRKRL